MTRHHKPVTQAGVTQGVMKTGDRRIARRSMLTGLGSLVLLAACGRATGADPATATPSAPSATVAPAPTSTIAVTATPIAATASPSPIPTALPTATAAPTATTVPPTATAAPPTAPPTATAPPPTSPPPTAVPTQPPAPTAVAPSAPAAAKAPVATFGSGLPRRLRVPQLRLDAAVEHVGLARDGSMDVPKGYDTVGWYMLGSKPGDIGSAVLAGHLDSKTGPAIFWRLGDLRPGNDVFVRSDDGERRFVVEALERYRFDAAPLERIFAAADRPRLNLITCTGVFDRGSQNYDLRLVVYAARAD